MNFPTILHRLAWGDFRIVPVKPLYYRSDDSVWYRVLMMQEGRYLLLRLTPLPGVWNQIIWEWRGFRSSKDYFTHHLFLSVWEELVVAFGQETTNRLTTADIWAEIAPMWPESNVSDWLARCGYNGGIALDKLQKDPPTWEEIHLAHEKRQHEEREAKIAAVFAGHDPPNEEERSVGRELAGHDWTYSYSDCGEAWRRGNKHREELERRLKALPPERARLVWECFAPSYANDYWRCPV